MSYEFDFIFRLYRTVAHSLESHKDSMNEKLLMKSKIYTLNVMGSILTGYIINKII